MTGEDLAEILDQALKLYRRNWLGIWQAMAPLLFIVLLLSVSVRVWFGIDSSWTLLFLLPPWEVWNALLNIVRDPEGSFNIMTAGLFLFLVSQSLFTYV